MIGQKIGKYRLTSYLGEGGMASVYEGVHETIGSKAAVKILNPSLSSNNQIRERFKNEAKFMFSLKHPNIATIYDFEESDSTLAIVMELLEGNDLNSYLKIHGRFTDNHAFKVFQQILSAFEFAHDKGYIHRDIKPSNIFILPDGTVKILDFGIAKIFGQDSEITQTGTQLGTPMYMSPEQVRADKSIDYRSDIYSLGVLLHTMLQGKAPYDKNQDSNYFLFKKIVEEPLPPLTFASKWKKLIDQACQKERNHRIQSCGAWSRAMRKMNDEGDGGKTVLVGGNSFLQKSLLRSKYFGLFIGVLFLAIVLLFIDLGRSNSNIGITNTVYPAVKDSVQSKDSTVLVDQQLETENKSKEDVQNCLNLLNRWSNMLAYHNINDAENLYDFDVHYYTQILSKEKVIENIRLFLAQNSDFYQEISNKNIITRPDGTFKCEFDKNTFMNGKNKNYPSYLIMKYNSFGELKIIHESDYLTDENVAKKARKK
jgi:serine/threonine protein kinase